MKLNVSTISPARKFLPELAAGIIDLAGGLGPDLTRFRILLPTRRACRELRAEFLRRSDGKPLLLPRMHPLGDIDQEELDLMIAGTVEGEMIETVPPALSALERQMILTRLVQAQNPDMRGEQCLSLARALGRLMDQVYTEDLSLADLPALVENTELSVHWTETTEFLKILSEVWPAILDSEGRIDSAHRRNLLLKQLAEFWRDHPPSTPIIAAGSTGSIPATGNLLHVIAGLPQGHVILPGLDRDMDDTSWNAITETHPQNTMKRLITRMQLERADVTEWYDKGVSDTPRLQLAKAATCPSDTCDNFSLSAETLKSALHNVALIEADNPRHEAQLIALAVREALEIPDRKIVIITPDRNLARRISAALKRWEILVDDSAGQPLHMKQAGIFVARILYCLREDFAPLPLLDLLKTPYISRHIGADAIAALEIAALRGPRPASGLEGLRRHVKDTNKLAVALLDLLDRAFASLVGFTSGSHSLSSLIAPLVECAEILSGGADNLWRGADAESLSLLLRELESTQHALPPADIATLAAYLTQFMSERKVRPAFGTHPRVTILGQIEARLIGADLAILAGLNEGSWPPEPPADPWMSRQMRHKFGLPPVERQTGLSAHDFVQAFNLDEVLMTRSRKVDNTPSVPARWLERIVALLEKAEMNRDILTAASALPSILRALDAPDVIKPIEIPAPVPPVALRPTTLGVTGIEKLMKNPYQIYARYVLGLRPLDPIDEDVTASDRGEFIHDLLNAFIIAHPVNLPRDSEAILLRMGEEKLAALEQISPAWRYWWPRFKHLVPHFIAHERKWREENRPWKTEIEGIYTTDFNGVPFTLTAKADRIDMRGDGAAIIDYKTGSAPQLKNFVNGKSPQLSLEAMLLEKGAFEGKSIDARDISLSYWVLTGKPVPLEIEYVEGRKPTGYGPIEIGKLVAETEDGFTRLMTAFMSEATPYYPVIPSGNRLYDEEKAYKHLARTEEWGVVGDAESEDAA